MLGDPLIKSDNRSVGTMQDHSSSATKSIFRRVLDRIWIDREIILRSDGRMRFLYLTRNVQLALLIPVLLTIGWITAATTGFFHQREVVAAKDVELGQANLAYLDLLDDIADFQTQFANTNANLKDRQAALIDALSEKKQTKDEIEAIRKDLAARDTLRRRFETFVTSLSERAEQTADLNRHVDALRTKLAVNSDEREEILAARDALRLRLQAYRTEVDGLTATTTTLNQTVDALRTSLSDVTQDRDAITEERNTLQSKLAEANASLDSVRADNTQILATLAETEDLLVGIDQDRENTVIERDELVERLNALDSRLTASLDHGTLVEQQLDVLESALHGALLERGELASDRRRLEARVERLETRLTKIGERHLAMMSQLTERTETNVAMIERVVKMTGVNIDRMLKKTTDRPIGQGGPFISAVEDLDLEVEYTDTVAQLDQHMDRLDGLRKLLAVMPLQVPLDSNYRVTSNYGIRKDPLNGKKAFHSGMDFGAPRRTPVYTPSAGKVTFAGWRGNYGRMVEIDHGFGIRTRYAHLRKVLVKKGAEVDFRDKIGQVGNSGRSTGPHLHYEVIVDKKTNAPRRFLKAGRYVFKEQ